MYHIHNTRTETVLIYLSAHAPSLQYFYHNTRKGTFREEINLVQLCELLL